MKNLSYTLSAISVSRSLSGLLALALLLIVFFGVMLARLIGSELMYRDATDSYEKIEVVAHSLQDEIDLRSFIRTNSSLIHSLSERIDTPISKAREARYLQESAQTNDVILKRLEQHDKNEAGQEVTTVEVSGSYTNTKKWLRTLPLAPTIWVTKEISIVREGRDSSHVLTQVKLLSYAR